MSIQVVSLDATCVCVCVSAALGVVRGLTNHREGANLSDGLKIINPYSSIKFMAPSTTSLS